MLRELALVAWLVTAPPGATCTVSAQPAIASAATLTVTCESATTGKWLVAVIDRATGRVHRANGRRA